MLRFMSLAHSSGRTLAHQCDSPRVQGSRTYWHISSNQYASGIGQCLPIADYRLNHVIESCDLELHVPLKMFQRVKSMAKNGGEKNRNSTRAMLRWGCDFSIFAFHLHSFSLFCNSCPICIRHRRDCWINICIGTTRKLFLMFAARLNMCSHHLETK